MGGDPVHIQLNAYDAFGQLWVTVTKHDESSHGGYWIMVVRRQTPLGTAMADLDDEGLLLLLAQVCERAGQDANVWPATDEA